MLFLDEDSPSLDIPYQDLILGEKLGSGGFKDCYKGMFMLDNYYFFFNRFFFWE